MEIKLLECLDKGREAGLHIFECEFEVMLESKFYEVYLRREAEKKLKKEGWNEYGFELQDKNVIIDVYYNGRKLKDNTEAVKKIKSKQKELIDQTIAKI